jgi:hypothetical protein
MSHLSVPRRIKKSARRELSCVTGPAPDRGRERVVGRRRRVVCDCCAAEVVRELEGTSVGALPPWACGRIEIAFGRGEVVWCALGRGQ